MKESDVVASTAHADLQNIGNLEPPQRGNPSAVFDEKLKDLADGRFRFVSVKPRQGRRTIEDQAHGRDASRSALRASQSKAPSPACTARSRMRCNAAWACERSTPPSAGTSLATGLPWRVMTISSPRSTRSNNALNLFFASNAPTSTIATLQLA